MCTRFLLFRARNSRLVKERVFLKISRQSAADPANLITGLKHISPGVLLGHPEKIHLVQCRDDAGSVAAEGAVKIDGLVTFVSKDGHYGFDMLLRRRDGRGIHPSRYEHNAISFGFFLLRPMQKGKKLQIHDVLDVPRLKKLDRKST